MGRCDTLWRATAAAGAAVMAAAAPAAPALAHGTPTDPVSRTAACAAGAPQATSAACRAARAANGRPFGAFDNLRVPGVAGRDRQYIPDGNLCSGDLPEFQGLDLARADWPATRLTAGRTLTVRYATTIPHRGTFRVYLTRPGYDPVRPLRWADLGAEPIITAVDPPVRAGAYRFAGRLPADRTGRHVLYVVWQNSSTVDTYYSCSDVDLRPAATKPVAKTAAGRPKAAVSRSPEPGVAVAPADTGGPAGGVAARESWIRGAGDTDRIALGRQLITAALVVLAGVTGALAYVRIRRGRTAQQIPRRRDFR
jgi:predicted carbohydrate-binding protein with CBM5 and CBM33 domain